MELYIVKRDGRIQPFDKEKIINAVCKAFISVDKNVNEYALKKAENIAKSIEERIANGEFSEIEEIQDAVEDGLMRTKRKDIAKEYILYRDKRSRERQQGSKLHELIKEKLNASNVQNANANVDEHSFGGRMGEANSAMLRQLALDELISSKVKYNHLNNRIYIHDLDWYYVGGHNCLSIPFDDLLANGFKTRQTEIRPANSVATAFQLVAVIIQCQSLQQFG